MDSAEQVIEQQSAGRCLVEIVASRRVCAVQSLQPLVVLILACLFLLSEDTGGAVRSIALFAGTGVLVWVVAKSTRLLIRLWSDPVLLCATESHLMALDMNRWCRSRLIQRSAVSRVEILKPWFGRRGQLLRIHLRDERPITILPLAASGFADYAPPLARWIEDADTEPD